MKKNKYALIGITVGAVVGMLVGFFTFTIPLGFLIGIGAGFIFGSFLDKKKF